VDTTHAASTKTRCILGIWHQLACPKRAAIQQRSRADKRRGTHCVVAREGFPASLSNPRHQCRRDAHSVIAAVARGDGRRGVVALTQRYGPQSQLPGGVVSTVYAGERRHRVRSWASLHTGGVSPSTRGRWSPSTTAPLTFCCGRAEPPLAASTLDFASRCIAADTPSRRNRRISLPAKAPLALATNLRGAVVLVPVSKSSAARPVHWRRCDRSGADMQARQFESRPKA
jgi:hypothetical protein